MSDETLLEELLSRWQQQTRTEPQIPLADLCRDHPDLLPELQRRIEAVHKIEALAQDALAVQDPPPIVRTTDFDKVVSLCEVFTVDELPGAAPSLGRYLEGVAEDVQPVLLRNLLAIEIQKRRAASQTPQVEEYLHRFPQFAALIREAFLENSSISSVGNPSTQKPKIASVKVPVANRLGDYRLLGELGRGGMGVVYEAVHLRHGNHVALKTLPTQEPAALHRFKREFRVLADINHPNLIGLHNLQADGSQWFFTMDLVEGISFLDYVRPGGITDEGRLRAALTQLVTAVMALHSRHIIHRDLKPSNVMVTREGRVLVLDFGLVVEQNNANANITAQNVAGTPRYMAPEQAAGGMVTAACDWYAVGVMVYEALCGRAPFMGPMLKVIHDKQKLDAPPLDEDPAIPKDLAALSLRLVAREPQQRPDPLAIAGSVSAGVVPSSSSVVTPSGGLVGRDQQLLALQDAYQTMQQQQQPLTVFVSGRSGEGKTSLVEQFLTPLRADKRLAVMSGRCYERESVPFKALDNLIDALCGYLRSRPEMEVALVIPDDVGMLAQVFPVMRRVEVIDRAIVVRPGGMDEHQVRQRAFRALRSMLSRLSQRMPVVWFIDDLQWGDADSAEALFEVLRPPEAPGLLLLGTFRSDETEGSAFLKMWKELQHKHDVRFADREVKVGPLTAEECTELVIGQLGRDDEVIRRRSADFARETRGNPFLLIELIGCFDPDADSFEPKPLHEVLTRKLERLPAEAGSLLEVVAVSGQALSLEEASLTAGHVLLPVATLTRMRNERLVRLTGPEERLLVDTYHDRVRETVLAGMDKGRCQTLHKTLATVIEKEVGGVSLEQVKELESGALPQEDVETVIGRVYDLAYHFDAAGEKERAWVYALLAAEQARRQYALEVAVNNYALAKRNAEETSNFVQLRIAEGWGESLMFLGRYEEANQQLAGIIDLVDEAERKARIELLQGEIAFKQGFLDKSIAIHETGLRRLGNWVPRTWLGLVCVVLQEMVLQCVHSLAPWQMHRQPRSRFRDLSVLLFFRLGRSYAFQNSLKWVWAHLAGMNRAEWSPPSPPLSYTYSLHNLCMSMLGWHARGSRYGDRAVAMLREFKDIWGFGYILSYQGIVQYLSTQYDEGITNLIEAIRAFEKAGDVWEVHLAHFHKGCCHFGRGDLAEAVAEARWTFGSSARYGDSRVLCSSYLWARATRGNIPFEELKSCYPCRPDDILSTCHGTMTEGHWHTFHGRTAEAVQAFERAGEMIRKTFCVNAHTILVLPELAGALRRHAEVVQAQDAVQAAQLRSRAFRLARWGTRLTWLFPAAYPLALRERSLILAACGKTKQALKFADQSCAVALGQKAKYEYAQSLLVRGQLARQLGKPEGEEQIRTAEAAIEALEQPVHAEVASLPPADPKRTRSNPVPQAPIPADKLVPPGTLSGPRRGLLWAGLVGLVVVAGALGGHVAGRCAGYVIGFVTGAFAGDLQAWKEASAGLGAAVGRVVFPLLLLVGWALVRWGQRHYQAGLARKPTERPSPPPAVVRHGQLGLLCVLVLSLALIPAALGIWLGSWLAMVFGIDFGLAAIAMAGMGGGLGFGLPFLLWRSVQ